MFAVPFPCNFKPAGIVSSFASVGVTGGKVNEMFTVGTLLYVFGTFTQVADAGGTHSRGNGARLDLTTALWDSWDPAADNTINRALLVGSSVYCIGLFTTLGGQSLGTSNSGASVAVSTALYAGWRTEYNGLPNAICYDASTTSIFVGGFFTSAGGNASGLSARNHLAKFNTTTGAMDSWTFLIGGCTEVNALEMHSGSLYAGGLWIDGVNLRVHGANVDPSSGTIGSWNPNVTGSRLWRLIPRTSTILVFGSFSALGTGPTLRNNAGEDNDTGAGVSSWNPNVSGTQIYDAQELGGYVYMAGNFTSIGGSATNVGRVDSTTGAVDTGWLPTASGGSTGYPYVVEPTPFNIVFVGGEFATVNGQSRTGFAAINATTGAVI